MTIVAWDGSVLATDSKVSSNLVDDWSVEDRKIWLFKQPVVYKRYPDEPLEFHAAALVGSGRIGMPIINGIINYCRDRTKTLNHYRYEWVRIGAHWPEAVVAQVILVGKDATGAPVCCKLVRNQESPLVPVAPGTCFGSGAGNLAVFTSLGLTAVELVELGILAQPKWCGGDIQIYNVNEATLTTQPSGVDIGAIHEKARTLAVGAVNQFFRQHQTPRGGAEIEVTCTQDDVQIKVKGVK